MATVFSCPNGYFSLLNCIDFNIPIIRCNRHDDCEDVSDEKGCKLVDLDESKYLKENPPQDAEVKIKIELLKILEIGEVEMLFRTQYAITLEWFDARLTYYNLHSDQELNKLTNEEAQQIWIPSMIFDNTDDKTRTKRNEEYLLSIKKEGIFSKSNIDNVDNIFVYDGADNPIEMNQVYHTSWFEFIKGRV